MHYELIITLFISAVAALWLTLINTKRRRWLRRHQISVAFNLPEKSQTLASLSGYLMGFAPAIWFIYHGAWAGLLMWLAGLFIIGWILVEVLSPNAHQ